MVFVITVVVALTNFNTPLKRSTDGELRRGVKGVQGPPQINQLITNECQELSTYNMVVLPEPLPFWHYCQHLPAVYVYLVGIL